MGLFILPRTNAAAHRHPQRTCLAALALACLLTANAGTLAGCASSHPITKSGEQCASCHSDGRAAVEGTGSASATETGLTFAVESGAGEVYLCTAAVGPAMPLSAKVRFGISSSLGAEPKSSTSRLIS